MQPDNEPTTLAEKIDAILEQTRLTNGRVTRLEEEVYGDEHRRTAGLKQEVAELKGLVLDTRAVARALRWVIPVSFAGVGALVALIQNL